MFSAVLGLFSQDLAVDLGSATTRVHLHGAGLVRVEPTLLSILHRADGQRTVLAIGDDAKPMLGRTPADIQAVQPVVEGHLEDFEATEAFLLHLIRKIHGRNGLMRPRMVITVPNQIGEMELRAVRGCCEAAGGRDVQLLPRALAAALGAELPITEPNGTMIVDIGAGCTELSVLSMGEVVVAETLPTGGHSMDQAITRWMARSHDLCIGAPTAERVKLTLGGAAASQEDASMRVKGRCLRTGVPRAATVRASEVCQALAPDVTAIAIAIRQVLDNTPPELASDIVNHGVVLVGGGAQLRQLEPALRHATGLPMLTDDSPETAVIRGAGQVLDELDLLAALAS